MKIKKGYILRTVADTHIVVPVAERVAEFKGMMLLNDISAAIWKQMQEDRTYEQLLEFILESYDIDRETAEYDLNILIHHMKINGVLDD